MKQKKEWSPYCTSVSGKCKIYFTLIELLVVISIILILVSLLFPALKQARMKAHSTTCINNLKQMGMSLTQYADSYDMYCPLTQSNERATDDWVGRLIEHGFLKATPPTDLARKGKSNVWQCPTGAQGIYRTETYGFRTAVKNGKCYEISLKTVKRNPASTWWMIDNRRSTTIPDEQNHLLGCGFHWEGDGDYYSTGPSPRHGNSLINMWFLDGHAGGYSTWNLVNAELQTSRTVGNLYYRDVQGNRIQIK